ncbi:unnamed protein product [Thelazia callipaeda]|uniref:Anillin domain-containing protein n=1 Tax=Thelazia callipaeda TaxID=103827 RepID=A0A0N5CKV4_THECL|nr:unnamed protein product [Thelazia callipaeda]
MAREINSTASTITSEDEFQTVTTSAELQCNEFCNLRYVGGSTTNQFSSALNSPSRARIGVSQVSVPLAWKSDEHFGTRGEGKMYSMFIVLQANSNIIDSRIVTTIDRTCTDVTFKDSFIFENQPVDFEIGIQLYALRTDGGDISHSLKQKLTRSLGRRFGTTYKNSWFGNEVLAVDPVPSNGGGQDVVNNGYFHLLGQATLTLSDAKPKTGIYDLHLSPNGYVTAINYGPPLYGHIRCRIVAQPNSVLLPLLDGILTIKPIGDSRLYHNMRCKLQAGVLKCNTDQPLHLVDQTLHIYINKDSKVTVCKHEQSIIVTSDRYLSGGKRNKQFILTAESEEDIAAWQCAISMQIADCEQWGEFAVSSIRLTTEPEKPDVVILSRRSGRRLYDEIQIEANDSVPRVLKNDSHNEHQDPFLNSVKMVSFASTTKFHQTAPSGRRRNARSHVRDLFQAVAESDHRYIINLPIGQMETDELICASSSKSNFNCFQLTWQRNVTQAEVK